MEPISMALGTAAIVGLERFFNREKRHKDVHDYLNHYWIISRPRHGKTSYIRTKLIPEYKRDFPSGSVVMFETKDESTIIDYLNSLPVDQHDKTIVFAPIDMRKYGLWMGLNLLEKYGSTPTENTLLSNELIACFDRAFPDSIKANSKDILRNGSLSVLEVLEQASLLEVYNMFNDRLNAQRDKNPFRDSIVGSLRNPFLKNFFQTNFMYPSMATMDIYNPIYNKIRSITNDPVAANCMCQLEGLNIREIIDNGYNLVFFFPKGELGPELSRILSSIAFSKVQLAVQSRSNMNRLERLIKPVMIIADEFQDYAAGNTSFYEFLSQAGGFGACLVLAHQNICQAGIDEKLIKAIMANVGNVVAGRLGDEDAEKVSEIMRMEKYERQEIETAKGIRVIPDKNPYDKEYFKSLDKFRFVQRLTINGKLRDPKVIKVDPTTPDNNIHEKIRLQCLMEYGLPTGIVEENIRERLEGKI